MARLIIDPSDSAISSRARSGRLLLAVGRGLAGVATSGTLLLVALAPWPLGANRPWAWSLIGLGVIALLVVRGLSLVLGGADRVRVPAPVWLAAVFFGLLVAWIIIQAGPAPDATWAHPVWRILPEGLAGTPAISLDPFRSYEALFRLLSYAGMVVLGYLIGLERTWAERALWFVLAGITIIAGFGLIRQVIGLEQLFGEPLVLGRVSGSFVNPNHFAAYVNLGVLAALCPLLKAMREIADSPHLGSATARLLYAGLDRNALLFGVFGILVLATLASGSRGGVLSLLLTVAVVLASTLRQARLPLAAVALLLIIATAFALTMLGGEITLERLAQLIVGGAFEPTLAGRINIWSLAIEQIAARPWLGHGYGAFGAVFDHTRDRRFSDVQFDYAHSTWLELLAELGLAGGLLLILTIGLLLLTCWAAIRRGTRSSLPLIGAATTLMLALHSLVDFAWQIPAVALTWACLTGLACGRAAASRALGRASPKVE